MDKTQEEQNLEKKIGQLQNQQKILLNRKRSEEHRARTHRLIERGAILEAVFPPVAEMVERGSQGVSGCPLPLAGVGGGDGDGLEKRGDEVTPSPRAHLYTAAGVVRPAGGCCVLRTRWGLRPQTPASPPNVTPALRLALSGGANIHHRKEALFTAIFHCPIQIIQRSKGKSAVAAAAYRSGEKLVNEWDGMTHDYTHKGGVVHSEIMLPSHAPPEFADRSTLWNSVEQIEKSATSQLAREIEVALPVELSRAEQLALVRAFVKDNFVDAGMCADFAIHDKGDGNPHAHILLTIRPLKENGEWGAKCRRVYDLDGQGQRIPDGKGGWKSHREDTTDWNQRGNAEKWRAAWAASVNRALEAAGRPERIDHRSYKRQGIDKIPTVHMGPAASQMERRGIATVKGNINREIDADNKLLKEIKARITRLYNWSKEQAETVPSQDTESIVDFLFQHRQTITPTSNHAKVKTFKENVAVYNFLQANGISSMQELFDKVSAMNGDYYDLRGKIVSKERRISALKERLDMWEQYQKYKPIRQKLDKVAPGKREQFAQQHSADLSLFDAAVRYLDALKASGESVTPKAWRAEVKRLTAEKDADYLKMRDMRENINLSSRIIFSLQCICGC